MTYLQVHEHSGTRMSEHEDRSPIRPSGKKLSKVLFPPPADDKERLGRKKTGHQGQTGQASLASAGPPVGMIIRGRRSVAAGLIIPRLVMMGRRNDAARQGKSHAKQRDKNESTHDNSFFFPMAAHVRLKVAVAFRPPSGLFSSVTSPPCMRAMPRAMDRPRPVPPVLRLREPSTL